MATGKITKRLVDGLRARARADGRTLYAWDEDLTGFGLVATKTGAASYFIEYRLGGRGTPSKRVSIGKHGALTPDQARVLAKGKLGEVAKGRDVAQEKREARRRLAAGTFKEVAERYLMTNGRSNKSWSETRRLLEYDALPELGNKPMVTVTRADVATLLDNVAARKPSVARALFAALRPMFRWAVDRGIVDVNPITDLRGPAPLPSRCRVLSADEIKTFWKAIERLGWPFYPIYRLLLLTGQRREEVAGMRWVELDLDKAIWIMPAERAKNKLAHTVDLSPQVVAILANLPLMSEGLVFTTTGNTPVSGFSMVKARLDKAMWSELGRGLEAWRNADLRRTMATLMGEELEIDPGVIERILNPLQRSQGGSQGAYQRQQYNAQRKAAMFAWGAWVERLVKDEDASNVVALHGTNSAS
jgi:integrase